jgi:monofunctional biosynthetic peptidoglycan transglycosylase
MTRSSRSSSAVAAAPTVARYAVVGNPIQHSLSPQIHALFADKCRQQMTYEKLLAPLDGFEEFALGLRDVGYAGLNVTIPFKLDAAKLADELTPRARLAGAVNTLKFDGDAIFGDNTDGIGFVRDVQGRLKFAPQDAAVLILGAGGGVRGLIGALLEEKPRWIAVANRTHGRAQELADEFGVEALTFDEVPAEHFDLVINGTPTGLHAQAPNIDPCLRPRLRRSPHALHGAGPPRRCQGGQRRPRHADRAGRRGLPSVARRASRDPPGVPRVAARPRRHGARRRCRGAMTRVRRAGRWLLRLAALALALLLALQLWYLGWVALWRWHNPAETAFMERERARLQARDERAQLRHQWQPYERISVHLKRAVVAAEDARFLEHEGVDWEALQKAFETNLKRGRPARGGSTISQQLAKNLFLSSERSYVRKAQELAITWMIEALWDKRRILEVYLNVVEWGEGVFGAEAAARHYFGLGAGVLGPEAAARLASFLPSPKRYGRLRSSPYLDARTAAILRYMPGTQVP